METKLWKRTLALGLTAALVLSGCGGGGEKTHDPTPSAAVEESEAPRDYSKYNTYLDLTDDMAEVEEVLEVYFDNVEYAPDFALVEGGDYAAIKDIIQFYTPMTHTAEKALEYADEEPSYPEADAAMKALGESPVQVMEALNHLASYLRFDDFEEDSMAKAPELHAELMAALETYDLHFGEFFAAINTLAEESRDEDREQLLEDGEMILYYSLCLLHTSEDILDEIMAQVQAASEEAGEQVLPPIDSTITAPLFGQLQTAYEGLTEAMGKEEEQAKIKSFSGKVAENAMKLYTNKVNALYISMGNLAKALTDGADYVDAFNSANEAISGMVGAYNSIL